MVKKRLRRIWAEIFEKEGIPDDVSFYQLGGDSILAVRLTSRIRKEFGVDFPADCLSRYGTIDDLSAFLEGGKAVGGTWGRCTKRKF